MKEKYEVKSVAKTNHLVNVSKIQIPEIVAKTSVPNYLTRERT